MSEQNYARLINHNEELIELKQLCGQSNNFNNQQWKHQQQHLQAGELLKSFVYAGFDGINSTLIIILSAYYSGMAALNLYHMVVAIVIGGAADMALADYLSEKAQIQHIQNQYRRQQFEVETSLQEQKKQIIQIYTSKGYNKQESYRISELISTNKIAFVNIMMLQELSLVVRKQNISVKRGLITFVSFNIYGMLTGLPYVIAVGIMQSDIHPIKSVIVISTLLFISIGYSKARILGLQQIKSIKQVLFVGFLVSVISMVIGMAFQ